MDPKSVIDLPKVDFVTISRLAMELLNEYSIDVLGEHPVARFEPGDIVIHKKSPKVMFVQESFVDSDIPHDVTVVMTNNDTYLQSELSLVASTI